MTVLRAEVQYLNNLRTIVDKGFDVHNERTNSNTRTYINLMQTYDAKTNKAPIVTTRKVPLKLPIAELIGYIRGYTNAKQFRELGTKSWDMNANENEIWLNNPNRKGEDDLGLIYGAVANKWPVLNRDNLYVNGFLNLFEKVYNNLSNSKDDRGEIISFWNPGAFHLGCLRPCLHTYQFSLGGMGREDLYLTASQRSCDFPLGGAANMVQVWLFLRLMAQITNKNPKLALHQTVNGHIYEDQIDLVKEQLTREPLAEPTIDINPDIKTLKDLQWVTLDDFKITYDEYHPPINYPFTV